MLMLPETAQERERQRERRKEEEETAIVSGDDGITLEEIKTSPCLERALDVMSV